MTSKPVFQNLELQPIAGQWRAGSGTRTLDVTDPFTGEQLLSVPMATREDLDEAYRKAAEAQREWAAMGPTERGSVMRRAVEIFDERKEDRKSTRLNSSHVKISYAVFCLKKKK